MTKTTSRALTFGIMGLLAVVLIIDPFRLFQGPTTPPLPVTTEETITSSSQELLENARNPGALIASLFETNRIVVIGEYGRIKEEIDFTASILPYLRDAGVDAVGVEFLLSDDQDQIDKLIESAEFDETLARRLLFQRNVIWGYQEYVNLMRAVWSLNHPLIGKAFKLVGLNVRQEYSAITKEEDMSDPEILKKVLSAGLPDEEMAHTVLETVSPTEDNPQGLKALLFVQRDSSFATWEDRRFASQVKQFGLGETRRMARIVRDGLEGQVATVLLHSPWPNKNSPAVMGARVGFPVSGLIDRVLAYLGPEKAPAYPFAFDLRSTTLGRTQILQTDYLDNPPTEVSPENPGTETPPLQAILSDFGTVYVVLGPIKTLHAATPIEGFVTQENLKEALRDFPGPSREDATPEQVNEVIARVSSEFQKTLGFFEVTN